MGRRGRAVTARKKMGKEGGCLEPNDGEKGKRKELTVGGLLREL